MNNKTQALIAKMRALMERTTANGCSEAEALTAASLLQKLMEKEGLTADDLAGGQTEASDEWYMRENGHHPIFGVTTAVGLFSGTRIYRGEYTDRQTTTDLFGTVHVLKNEQTRRLRIVGLEHEVEIARYVLDICCNAMDTAAAKALQAENEERAVHGEPLLYGGERKKWVFDFQVGMASRMAKTLKEMAPTAPVERQLAKGTGRDLVAIRTDLIDQWFRDKGITLSTGRVRQHGTSGYASGHAAGANVRFHSGVGSGQRNVRALGSR